MHNLVVTHVHSHMGVRHEAGETVGSVDPHLVPHLETGADLPERSLVNLPYASLQKRTDVIFSLGSFPQHGRVGVFD